MESVSYRVDGYEFSTNPEEIKKEYNKIINYNDKEFMENLPEIMHYCCFVGWRKKMSLSELLSDKGLIHELVHLMSIPDEPLIDLQDIRNKFEKLMKWEKQQDGILMN